VLQRPLDPGRQDVSAAAPVAPVIMCGGAGTRLWPASTETWPKPFRAFGDGPTLFQSAALRVSGGTSPRFLPPVVICGEAHLGLVEAQLGQIGVAPGAIVLEPCARGTAALAVVAARVVAELYPGARLLLLPADHAISDVEGFRAAIGRGGVAAGENIVTLAIAPDRPETGYGYIQSGAALGPGVARVARFVEKPDAATAQAWLDAGGSAWNAGIFLCSPEVLLSEFTLLAGDIADTAGAALDQATRDGEVIRLDEAVFAGCRSEAIDRAIMERTNRAAVVACDIGWTDVGSWSELWRMGPRDAAGVMARGPVTTLDVTDSLVWSDGPTVAVLGVSDLMVVAAGGSVLVASRTRAQAVRDLVEALKAARAPVD
jgi:mannose-1-phosphate guanylyltransferase/mannose-6-phosphate isomerase